MADSVEAESRPPSRRRRQQNRNRDDGTGLSVAELLARHATPEIAAPAIASDEVASDDDEGLPTPRRVHRRTPAPVDQTDQFILGGAGLGHASTDQYLLDALFGSLADMPANSPRSAVGPATPATPATSGSAATPAPDPDDNPTAFVARISEPKSGEPDAARDHAKDAEDPAEGPAKDPDGLALRTRKIDESLVRLTAIHAGLGAAMTARVSDPTRLPAVRGGDRSKGDHSSGGPSGGGPSGGGPPGTAAGGDRPPRALTRVAKVALLALVVLLFATIGVGWGAKSWLDAKLRSVVALDPNSESIVDKAGQHGDQNYLLIGSDSQAGVEAGSSDADGVGSDIGVPGARADTVMVAHIPAKRDRMVLVSFPRDLQVDRPGCDRWDSSTTTYPGGTAPAQRNVKLNSAYEIGGPRCVTKVVQRLTGLSINHFTAIDFAGFKEMVDSLAGVPICLDHPVVDSVLGRVVPTSGETVLAGDQALALVRARHVRGDPTSDYGRIERQQRVLTALLRKGLSEQVLLSPSKLRAFITAFGNYTLSDNTGLDELTTLGGSLRTIDPTNVTFVTPPTQGEPDRDGNEVLRKNDTDALFAAIRANRPLPSEAARAPSTDNRTRPAPPSDTTTPNRVTLAVRNGSSQAGLATQVADNLRSVGFKVSKVGDTEASPRTVIRHSPDRAEQAATLAATVPAAVTQETPGPAGLLELVLGNGFNGEVKAPVGADGGSSSTPPPNLSTVNAADASCR